MESTRRAARQPGRGDAPARSAQKALLALQARLGSRVREARKAAGSTIAGLATAAGLSPRFLNDVELGKANVSLQGLVKIGAALGIEPAALLASGIAEGRAAAPAMQGAVPAVRRFALVGL